MPNYCFKVLRQSGLELLIDEERLKRCVSGVDSEAGKPKRPQAQKMRDPGI